MAINEAVANDWPTLQRLVFQDAWNGEINRHRSSCVFRGMPDSHWQLKTSLIQFVGDSNKWNLETHLLRNFNKYCQQSIEEPKSVYHLLSLAQHYGLPTRLLDWTYSPLVAAYFATDRVSEGDGVIWTVDYAKVHETIPETMQDGLAHAGAHMFDTDIFVETSSKALQESGRKDDVFLYRAGVHFLDVWDMLEEYHNREGEYLVFFEPPPIDQRIANQSAVFSHLSNPRKPVDQWLKEHPDLYKRIIIPADRKPEFRDKLDQVNINCRTLFPGLEGLATWLMEYYEPRSA
jgi:hypothetical protein